MHFAAKVTERQWAKAFSKEESASLGRMKTHIGCGFVFKVLFIQVYLFNKTLAAPSPIIKFPGDSTPKTDKELAVVSVGFIFASDLYCCFVSRCFFLVSAEVKE